jgi:NTE family protein
MLIENITYSGGGIKGYSFIGVLRYFQEKGLIKNIKRVSGTSIGSIIALLQVIGFSSYELQNIASSLDLQKLEDVDLNLMISSFGLDDGSRIIRLLKYLLKSKKINENITFSKLFSMTLVELHITCCDLFDNSTVVFNHLLTPDTPVIYACRCSCSIPLIFTPVEGRYIDGCLSKNLPIDIFPVENTIGFYVPAVKNEYIQSDFQSYLMKIISLSVLKGTSFEISKYLLEGYKIIEIPVTVKALQVKISKEEVEEQIKIGYNSCYIE